MYTSTIHVRAQFPKPSVGIHFMIKPTIINSSIIVTDNQLYILCADILYIVYKPQYAITSWGIMSVSKTTVQGGSLKARNT
jgi:hypothetical protein